MKRKVTAEVFQYGYNVTTVKCRYSRSFRSAKMAYITVRMVAWLMDWFGVIPYPLGIYYIVYRNPAIVKRAFGIDRKNI